jgi:uncharacterized membrane protein YqhA
MFSFFAGLIARIRFLFVIPVLAFVGLSLAAMASGIVATVALFAARENGATFPVGPAELAGVVPFFIQSAFLFFLAVAFATLFLGELPVPQWMAVRNLHQLRGKLLTFLAIILPLVFLGTLVKADDPRTILYAGVGIGAVLAAIFALLRYGHPQGDDSFCREGTRCIVPEGGREGRPAFEPRPEARRDARPKAPEPEPLTGKAWLEAQKHELKFEVESLGAAMGARGGDKPVGEVTVGQAPRRGHGDRGRSRGRGRGRGGQGGGQGGNQPQGGAPSGGGSPSSFGGGESQG